MNQPAPGFLIPLTITLVMAGIQSLPGQQIPMPIMPPPGNGMAGPPSMSAPGPTGTMTSDEGEYDFSIPRDPFWPVGFVPKKPVIAKPPTNIPDGAAIAPLPAAKELGPPDWDAARKLLDIRGVSLIGRDKQTHTPKYLAMIGGKLVEEGDIVSVQTDSRTYRWKIAGISTSGISLIKVDVRPE